MALLGTDQSDLVLPLLEDMLGAAPWSRFLRRLLARTGADRVHLLERTRQGALLDVHRVCLPFWLGGGGKAELAALGGPSSSLRPNRVYSLGELQGFDDSDARRTEQVALEEVGIGDARLMQLEAGGGALVLLILNQRQTFGGAESALMSNLAPALRIVCSHLSTVRDLRLRLSAAEGTLERMGIGQAIFDEHGETIASDELWQSVHGLSGALAELGLLPPDGEVVVDISGRPAMVRAAGEGAEAKGNSVAAVRVPRKKSAQTVAQLLTAIHGLSRREAMLAALLAEGKSLIEAGRELHLTDQSVRTYSKRVYAKMSASGQADLVRQVLTGLAALA